MMMTSMPTLAPTVEENDPCSNPFVTGCSDETNAEIRTETLWMILWVIALVIFLCLPFCTSDSRRKVCWRRIKERRWISFEEDEEDWYPASIRRQLEQRRQRMEEQQRRFQTTRTTHDEIREKHLLQCMENYTMVCSWNEM
jgi:hypothetical protein